MIDIVKIFKDAATTAEYEFAYGRKDIQNWQLSEAVDLNAGETVLLVDPFVETAEIDNSIIFKWSVRTTIALGKKFDIYDDWFLPSKDLLQAIQTNLYNEGVGNLQDGEYYWSSTEVIATQAYSKRMLGNVDFNQNKSNIMHVRACRSFTAAIGAYSLRDTGPSGGLICYIDGNTYYEAAPSDLSDSIWSNIDNVLIGASAQGTAVGTGPENTTAIIGQAGHTDSAAKLCNDYDLEILIGTYAQLDETELQKHDRRLQTMRENMETLIKTIFCNEDLVLTAVVILREINQFDENIDIIAAEITFNYDS